MEVVLQALFVFTTLSEDDGSDGKKITAIFL